MSFSWPHRDDNGDASDRTMTIAGLSATPAKPPPWPLLRATWLARPAAASAILMLAGIILVIPLLMLADQIHYFTLIGDDFAYVSEARDWPTTLAHLFEPHNAHVVPIFRLWTFAIVTTAGRLENLPAALAAASYAGLVVAMGVMGYVIARETGRSAAALGAMAVLGMSSVSHPAVTWFSAGQSLWAGTACLVAVAAAQSWASRGGALRLAMLALSTLAAPTLWSGGLAAGPAAIAYLLIRKPNGYRWAAALLGGVAVASGLVIVALSRRQLQETAVIWERHDELWPRPIQGVLHTMQALVETGVFANLGISGITTAGQALALVVGMAALHAWSRGGLMRITPLAAAGATIAFAGGLIEYIFRGNLPFSSLRPLTWYYALTDVGAILFFAGWWTAFERGAARRITWGQAIGVLGLLVALWMVQMPRVEQQFVDGAPPYFPNEAELFLADEPRLARARYYKAEMHERQVRALGRLDRLDRLLARAGGSPEMLREIYGRILVPGIPDKQLGTDAFTMLVPRKRDDRALAALTKQRADISELLEIEPMTKPYWLDPNDPWARAIREMNRPGPDPARATKERS